MTAPPIPGCLCVATALGVPNSHMVTEASSEPVKSVDSKRLSSEEEGGEGLTDSKPSWGEGPFASHPELDVL